MTQDTRRQYSITLAIGTVAVGLILVVAYFSYFRSAAVSVERPPESQSTLPPVATSSYRNTHLKVKYVGSESCASCHAGETESFRQTGMGRSSALVDVAKEPPDASFVHTKSNNRYEVVRRGQQMWHREIPLSGNGIVNEFPVKYVVGSGNNARTYVIEDKGFLAESPITWYAKGAAWKMSPGYDLAVHRGFEREITEGCLYCHAGKTSAKEHSLQQINIHEATISCERCHGPGELHVALRENNSAELKSDDTIVNPPKLDRKLAEAICQQCHLHIEATVPARGRKLTDYRPGLPLEDYRQDYQFKDSQRGMNVVGHVEQMHLSRCYTQTESLTCTTCHNPHAFPRPEERVTYYRQICTQCHQPEHCKVALDRRQAESPDNNCVQCHMPSTSTEVQHVAFTHHRIGIHEKAPAEGNMISLDLVAWNDNPNWSELEKQLSLGIAYAQMSQTRPELANQFKDKSLRMLLKMQAGGIDDPSLDAILARFALDNGRPDAGILADQALRSSTLSPEEYCVALYVSGATKLAINNAAEAVKDFKKLTELRRYAVDWMILAECERQLGRASEAEKAKAEAFRISPSLRDKP